MLRRRRSLADGNEGKVNLSQSGLVKRNKGDAERMKKEKMAKLKMSPFPEDRLRGSIVPLRETQRLNQLSDLKMSLTFTGAEKASPTLNTSVVDSTVKSDNEQECYSSESHLAAAFKPSDVIELQKHVSPTVAKQQRKNDVTSDLTCMGANQGQVDQSGSSSSSCDEEQPSASIKSMWDNVVSWMKTAVDYIAYEDPEDATLPAALSPIGKKRLSTESGPGFPDDTPVATKRARNTSGGGEKNDESAVGSKGRKGSFGRQRRKNGRRMSFGGLRRAAAGAGGDGGLGELLKLEPIKEASNSPPPPPGTKDTTKQTTSLTNTNPTGPPPTTHDPSSSSQTHNELAMEESGPAVQKKKDVTSKVRDTFKSPTGILAGDLGRNLLIMSPPAVQATNKLTALPKHMQVVQLGSKAVRSKGSSLLTSTAMRFHSGNDGLNSILDGSPDPIPGVEGVGAMKKKKRIHRESLRQYYGNSINSPNLTEVPRAVIKVRRSPRLEEKEHGLSPAVSSTAETAGSTGGIPLPPPPPPVPFSLSKSKSTMAPQTPLVPPPPPPPTPQRNLDGTTHDCEMSDASTLSDCRTPEAINHSRVMLQNMQSRLRKKIKKRGGASGSQGVGSSGEAKSDGKVDIRMRQWAEIQARSRKMSPAEFLSFAEQKKTELQTTLERLESSCRLGSVEEVSAVVELLQESSQWFPGGSKQMKDTLPLYKTLEKKMEVLTEFVQVSGEMQRCSLTAHPLTSLNLSTALNHVRDEFESKHRHWGTILTSNASSWADLHLPVCHALLLRSRCYLCSLVMRFAELALSEASKITGILVSIKCARTTQVKEKLKECLQLMHTALPYFPQAPPSSVTIATDYKCSCQHCLASGDDIIECSSSYSQDSLLMSAAQVALSYVTVAQDQFTGFVCQTGRQEVCEHFEGILKMMNLLKQLVLSRVPAGVGSHQLRSSGVLALLPPAPGAAASERLGSAIHSSCVELIQHIVSQAQPFLTGLSPHSKEKKSKEIMLWMIFGCKYVNQTLEALGSDHADQRGIIRLLNDLQQMECLLPD